MRRRCKGKCGNEKSPSNDLRFRVTIQQHTNTRDAEGNVISTWLDVVTVWAGYEPNPSRWREFFAADTTNAESYARFSIRYRTDVTPANRLIFQNKIYDIVKVVDDPQKKIIQIIAKVIENGF